MNLFIPVLILTLSFCNFKKNKPQMTSDLEKKEPEMLLLKLTSFTGDVRILRDKTEISLERDLELEKEDLIQTGPTGSVELLLGIDHLIKVGNDSELFITNLLTIEGDTVTNISLSYGKVLTIISKEEKENLFTLITPNVLINMNNSVLLTKAFHTDRSTSHRACDKNSCLTKLIDLKGNIHVRQTGTQSDLLLEENFQILVSNEKELSQNMISPLDKNSFLELETMIPFLAKYMEKNELDGMRNVKIEKVVDKKKKFFKKTNTKIPHLKKGTTRRNSIKDHHPEKLKLDSNKGF